jgi:hypothetical protein
MIYVSLDNKYGANRCIKLTCVLCQSLTAQETDARNAVPYMDFPRCLTTQLKDTTVRDPNTFKITDTYQIMSQNLQLNQIPDYFIITVRKPMAKQTIVDSSTFSGISTITVSLNNSQDLLSNVEQADLWRMSVRNGSSQSFEEFSGVAYYADCKINYTPTS